MLTNVPVYRDLNTLDRVIIINKKKNIMIVLLMGLYKHIIAITIYNKEAIHCVINKKIKAKLPMNRYGAKKQV